ncbi:MAG: TetR/AcrR family transcriptional regulator [Sneathiella sp.]|nr:TetR/AcrR family transcriptional regulator [Sneathiella sp.]
MQQISDKKPTHRKKPLQSRSRDRVDLIICCTQRILCRAELTKITTSKIAKEAGIPVGSVYQYFKDCDAILLALGNQIISAENLKLEKLFEEVSVRAHWRHVVRTVITAFAKIVFEGDVRHRLDRVLSNNIEWQVLNRSSEKRMVQFFSEYQLFSERGLSPEDARTISRMIVASATATVMRARSLSSSTEANRLVEEMIKMVTAYFSSIFGD